MSDSEWDRPSLATEGDAEPDGIYTAVGRALSGWTDCEERLSALFGGLINAKTAGDLDVHSYASIDGFRNRLLLVRAAAEARFPDLSSRAAIAIFEALDAAEAAATLRNDLAHGGADRSPDDDPPRWYLYPGFFTRKRKLSRPPAYRYNAAQIEDIAKRFEELSLKVSLAITALAAHVRTSR